MNEIKKGFMRQSAMDSMKGFSLLELVVVIFIFLIISTVISVNYSSFNEKLSARNAAEEIASNGRKAQAFGLGVKEITISSTTYFPGYGVYFKLDQPTSYVFFADINSDFVYQLSNEKVEGVTLQSKAKISQLCANVKSNPPGDCELANVSAVYTRPMPQVTLKGSGSPSCNGLGGSYCDIEIKIIGPRGTSKTIVFWGSGQISVEGS